MTLRTPRDVLLAMYDLLESTRVMHRNCGVLHRDIGTRSVLIETGIHRASEAPGATCPSTTSVDEQPYEGAAYCSARYLLGESVDRTMTSNLLVGFDHAVALEPDEIPESNPWAGDPMFMARAIRRGRPLGIRGQRVVVSSTPELVPLIQAAYNAAHPDRAARFRCKTGSYSMNAARSRIPAYHTLRHDAESVFWLFVWWLANAVPPGAQATAINPAVLSALTAGKGADDVREEALNFPLGLMAYGELDRLVASLWTAVRPELQWATEVPYTDPEFLHEAMQRQILNFLVENKTATFMNLMKTTE
ncbi:hypothetical protein HYPSUDRAFT_209409 [Hypholoma sublateritium FD-334 SS-4]|uniref:Fungal-type protein kinase domain-containing protein n=1 Tax=Hypholoma sublateritium (strain FD-334 SS-4) TaxID=945553 RepID=A0A0D2NAD8_HYPSF|nr:hypothetical protein HYPSUDRAFT_209409 [Hypholoma sublateritium FD-334 SS-4]